jgi:tetratricopeptide (TPR) repeat protein
MLLEQRSRSSVFLSYGRGDDESFVRRLFDTLKADYDVWFDRESMPSRALTFLQEIREAIEDSNRLIVVVGPAALGSDYVRAEWQYALTAGKVVTPLLRLGGYNALPPELATMHCPDFRQDASWDLALAELRRIMSTPVKELGNVESVPLPPPYFQPRLAELSGLAQAVFVERREPRVLSPRERTVVLHGMGGVGKSVLAASFARSTETRRTFHDGVVWLSLGPAPDLERQFEVAASQTTAGAVGSGFPSACRAAGKLFGDEQHHLVILDDVWDAAHVEPFLRQLGRNSVIVVTARNSELAGSLEAGEIGLAQFSDLAALRYLADWSGTTVNELPADAAAVAAECGNLPFGLALCGAMVRNGNDWATLLRRLRCSDLEFLRGTFPDYPYTDLLRCLSVSLDDLERIDADGAAMFRALVVFPPDEDIPEAPVLLLWQHLTQVNLDKGRALINCLQNRGLLRPVGPRDSPRLQLHDLQYDYLMSTLADAAVLHATLVAAYHARCPAGWATAPDDGYFFDHLSYHLALANASGELGRLIGPEWMKAQFRRTGSPTAFARDAVRVHDYARRQNPDGWPLRLRSQILLARMQSRVTEMPVEALQALAKVGEREEAAGYASLMREGYKRIKAYVAIAEVTLDAGEDDEALGYLNRALDALDSRDSFTRSLEVRHIAPLLARTGAVGKAVELAGQLAHDYDRDKTFSDIARHLAGRGDHAGALQVIERIESPHQRDDVAAEIIPVLVAADDDETAIAFLRGRDDGTELKRAVGAMVRALARAGRSERAREVALEIEDPWLRAVALRHLAGALASTGLVEQAEQVAGSIAEREPGEWARHDILKHLVAAGQTRRALTTARDINDEKRRYRTIGAVVTTLTESGEYRSAIEICHSDIPDDSQWVITIKSVIEAMGGAQIHACLSLLLQTRENRNTWHRQGILCLVADRLATTEWATDLTEVQTVAAQIAGWEESELAYRLALAYAGSGMRQQAQALVPALERAARCRVLDINRLRNLSDLCLVLGSSGPMVGRTSCSTSCVRTATAPAAITASFSLTCCAGPHCSRCVPTACGRDWRLSPGSATKVTRCSLPGTRVERRCVASWRRPGRSRSRG